MVYDIYQAMEAGNSYARGRGCEIDTTMTTGNSSFYPANEMTGSMLAAHGGQADLNAFAVSKVESTINHLVALDGTEELLPYRHSGKRNTAGEVYYVWTCQTKSQKGATACPSKNIPEKMLQNTTAEVLGLDKFDEYAFSQQIEEVIVIGDDTLTFRFYDGHEVTTKWQSTAKTDWWTDERRRLWGERHKRKDTNPNKHLFYEFTGFIKCGCCGANYRCQSGKRKDGTPTRS